MVNLWYLGQKSHIHNEGQTPLLASVMERQFAPIWSLATILNCSKSVLKRVLEALGSCLGVLLTYLPLCRYLRNSSAIYRYIDLSGYLAS